MKLRTALTASTGALIFYGLTGCGPQEDRTPQGASASVRSTGEALIGGPFQLVDQEGRRQTEALLRGRWSLVFFGFTHCPDICPTTLQTLGAAKEALGPAGRDLQLVLVSVDPARDTPAALKAYLGNSAFIPGVIGLTGTEAAVAAAARAYRVTYGREGEGEGYMMQHTSLVYLMDPRGRFDRIIRLTEGPEGVAAELRRALSGNTAAS